MGNKVNHPDHYQNIAGVEAIDILNDVVKDLPGKQAAMLWNSMKYLLRFQKKNGVEDLKKAQNYLQYLINDIEAVQEAAKDISEKQHDILWDNWHSNEYGNMKIFAKSKEPKGMPSRLVFDTEYAAEEFSSEKPKNIKPEKGACTNKDDVLEASQPTNDVHVLCKSTVWGSADVYYSTELLKGTCTKILFNDIDARNTFALKFFKYLSHENSGFSIRELLDDLKYLWGEDDDNLSIDVPWKDIFKGFYMGEEGGKYSLEFIFNQEDK